MTDWKEVIVKKSKELASIDQKEIREQLEIFCQEIRSKFAHLVAPKSLDWEQLKDKMDSDWIQSFRSLTEPSYEDLEEQKKVLGELNKGDISLPIKQKNLYIEMFALNPKLYTEGEKKRLTKLEPDKRYVECLLGLSGVGKTFHVQARATQEYCILITACGKGDSRSSQTPFTDKSYYNFLQVMKGYSDDQIFAFAPEEIFIYLIARLSHLFLAIRRFPNITPAKYLAMQLNGEQLVIVEFYEKVRNSLLGNPLRTLQTLCDKLVLEIENLVGKRIGIILDEANAAATSYDG